MYYNEQDLREVIKSEAYRDKNHPEHDKAVRAVEQGYENLYPDDDRNSNPKNYYVWRTRQDGKARDSHAEREGKVFAWDNPPEGGHPGEDYNCRCYTEPYEPPQDYPSYEKEADIGRQIKYVDNLPEDDVEMKKEETSMEKAKRLNIYKENAIFDKTVSGVFAEEGGYEDNPKKIDQPTNMGITQATLNNFNKAHPEITINKPLKELTKDDAKLIYKLDYFDHYRIGKINDIDIAELILQMYVNGRPYDVGSIIQNAVIDSGKEVEFVGNFGPKTIQAVNELIAEGKVVELNNKLIDLRLKLEDKLPDRNKFPGRRKRFERMGK